MMIATQRSVSLILISLFLSFSLSLDGQIKFEEITAEAGIDFHYLGINEMGAGAAFFDMDNDGDEDLWISGGLHRDALYENDGTGHFTEIGLAAGLNVTTTKVTTGVVTGDLDNDGYRDVLVLTHGGFPNFILRNNQNKTFTELPFTGLQFVKGYSLAAAMADVNSDGLLDIYAGHYIEDGGLLYSPTNPDSVVGFSHECFANNLYINNGDWTFRDATYDWGAGDRGCALATVFTDYDMDFDPDLLVANDFGQWIIPNTLLQNDGESFTNVSEVSQMDLGIYGMGIAVGDYDQDMDLDYYVTNLGRNVLLQNNGDGTFQDDTAIAGVEDTNVNDSLLATGWGTTFIDLDNDTDLDLYVVNGYVPAADFIANARANPNRCYENQGDGSFQPVLGQTAVESENWGRGLAAADIDNDGDLDFLVGNVNRQATSDTIQKIQLFRNESFSDYNWLKIKLQGTTNNRDGFGSLIKIKANGRWYLQEANGGYGTHASQHSSIVHFGLGDTEVVDSLEVIWQGGATEVIKGITSNQLITVTEGGGLTNTAARTPVQGLQITCYPNPFKGSINIDVTLPSPEDLTMTVIDQLGRSVFQQIYPSTRPGQQSIGWEAPGRGIYFIRLQVKDQVVHRTVLSL